MDKSIETGRVDRPERNPAKIIFIIVSILAGLYFVTGVTALVFPDLGVPFVWMAFPVGPWGPPIQ